MGYTFLRVHDKNIEDEIEITVNTPFHTTTTISGDIASRNLRVQASSLPVVFSKIYFILYYNCETYVNILVR